VSILNQGGLGDCVAEAACQAIRMVDKRHAPASTPELCSRLWAYWHARAQNGWQKEDTGTYPRTVIKVLNALGRPPEHAWPHIVADLTAERPVFTRKPPPDVNTAAIDHRQANYVRIDETGEARVEAIRKSITAKKPVIFGTGVGFSFLSNTGSKRNIQPPINQGIAGGHAMVVTEYDAEGCEIVNSWGNGWRNGGFAHLAWSYMIWDWTADLWSIDLPAAA
jgi:C1A family cysteine protease